MTTEDQAKKQELGFFIRSFKQYGADYVRLSLVTRDAERHIRNISAPLLRDYGTREGALADLMIKGHIHNTAEGWRLIGFEPYFAPFSVGTASQCKAMARTLTRLNKQFTKDRVGRDPGDLLVSAAKALGATFCVEEAPDSPHGFTYDESKLVFYTIPSGRDRLREIVADKIAERGGGKPREARAATAFAE